MSKRDWSICQVYSRHPAPRNISYSYFAAPDPCATAKESYDEVVITIRDQTGVTVPKRQQEFIDSKLSLKKRDHPLRLLFADRQITYQPHMSRQDNHHHSRMLMFNLQALDRMIQNEKR